MTFSTGENVGPYQITEQLGSGGMATVYKAYHAALDRYVAIKVLHPAFKQDTNFLTRFQREARIVAKLEHPNIVPIYDYNEHDGQPYLVMRYIEGETLKARLTKGELPLQEIRRIIDPTGEALAYAHAQGVLHRDVKPSNILLTPEGGVFLADFGLARIAQVVESTLSQDSFLGTPQYISPEQAQGRSDLNVRTDVYSLGVVLYELLVGRVPYQADTPFAVIHDHIFTALPLPRSIKPSLSEPVERVLLKALAKDRDDRFSTVTELTTAFDRALQADLQSEPTATGLAAPIAVLEPASVAMPIGVQPVTTSSKTLPAAAPKIASAQAAPTAAPNRTRLLIGLGAVMAIIALVVIAVALVSQSKPSAGLPPQNANNANPNPNAAAPARINQLNRQFDQANQQITQGDIAGARSAFTDIAQSAAKTLIDAAPNLSPALQSQLRKLAGQSWLAAGQADNAQPQFEALNKSTPNQPEVLTDLAATYLLLDQPLRAAGLLSQAVSLDDHYTAAHALHACLLLKQNEPLRAASEYRQTIQSAAGSPPALQPWARLVLADLNCKDAQFK